MDDLWRILQLRLEPLPFPLLLLYYAIIYSD